MSLGPAAPYGHVHVLSRLGLGLATVLVDGDMTVQGPCKAVVVAQLDQTGFVLQPAQMDARQLRQLRPDPPTQLEACEGTALSKEPCSAAECSFRLLDICVQGRWCCCGCRTELQQRPADAGAAA